MNSLAAGLAAGAAAGAALSLACTAPPSAPALPASGMKLYYWPATGIAEIIRIMLADARISWED
eukprot:SAG22_NODE_13053_length_420_cov_1.124611_1_plen_63_part_10